MATHWAPLREPAFRRFLLVRLTADFAVQIQTVAVGWTVYDRTRDPFDLGLVGLSQFLPALVLFLVTGSVADRFRRSRIIGVCLAVEAICAGAFLAFMLTGSIEVWGILLVMACFGTARAFYVPAQQALLPNIVPAGEFAGAVATITGVAKFATIAGPMAGGLLYALAPSAAFAAGVVLLVGASALAVSIRHARPAQASHGLSWSELLAGFRYIGSQKVVFGAVTLDLCAVLLGGATALMPVYARDILDVGPAGLGLLNASPAIGGVAVALYLSFRPIRSRVGHVLFATVALFGLATIVFGVSRALELSIVALIVMGAADMISRQRPPHARPAADARSAARARRRRQRGLHRRIQRDRPVPRRRHGGADRHRAGGRRGRGGDARRGRPLEPPVPATLFRPALRALALSLSSRRCRLCPRRPQRRPVR